MIIHTRKPAKKIWRSQLTNKFMWPPPPIIQIINILTCKLCGHKWSRWRKEDEIWFEYVDEPEDWAWRICKCCRTTQNVSSSKYAEPFCPDSSVDRATGF